MRSVLARLRAAIEEALPYFDRAAEERWKVGFERDLASARATRSLAETEMGRQERRWLADIPRRYERYDDAVRGS